MNEDFETGLGSFRDVAQEAEFAFVTQKQGVYSKSDSLPESHFFSHTAPCVCVGKRWQFIHDNWYQFME